MKKFISITAILSVACLMLTGCFGMYAPQPTPPPTVSFASAAEFADAVAKAKADVSLPDEGNLKGLAYYYVLQAQPEGSKVYVIKVSTASVIVQYAAGDVTEDSLENQVQLAWLRGADVNNFMNQALSMFSNTGEPYKKVSSGGIDYLVSTPSYSAVVTPSPGDASAAPTTRATPPCQAVQWVQDGAAFVAVVPKGFTDEDIGKYCRTQKVELGQ